MPKPSIQEPPFVENEKLYQWMLELHSHVYGLGEDTIGQLDEDNLSATVAGGTITVSNVGTSGVGIFKQKIGVDLEFFKINSISASLSIALDGTDKIDLAVNPGILNTHRYTSNQTLTNNNHVVLGDTDGGGFTFLLEAGIDGTYRKVSNVGSSGNTLTLTPFGNELLVGENTSFDIFDGETLDLHYESLEGWVA